MLHDRDPNGPPSGRQSRNSQLSAMSRGTGKAPGDGSAPGKSDTLNPAIQSMLRTSTEMGNLGGLTGDGISNPRASQRNNAPSRASMNSSLSNHSGYNRRINHRPRPSTSSTARNSAREPTYNAPQHHPDTLSPTMMNMPGSSPMIPTRAPPDRDSSRSLSMTNTKPQRDFGLSANRSMGNLRNPPRLPSHRAASPAWSDAPGSNPRRSQGAGYQGPATSYGNSGRAYSSGHQGLPYATAPRPTTSSGNSGRAYSSGHQGLPYATGPRPAFAPGPEQGYSQGSQRHPYSSGQGRAYPPGQGQTHTPGHGQGQTYASGYGQGHISGGTSRRIPSDPNMGYSDPLPRRPHRSNRVPSPVYYQTPNGNIPPVPPMPAMYRDFTPAIHSARRMERSAKGSGSSGSTNMRADSDTPSSDLPQPPTPRDGLASGPSGNLTMRRPATPVGGSGFSHSPLYYDYSEQFETEEFVEYAEPMPTSFAKQPISVTEDRDHLVLSPEAGDVPDDTYAAEIERSELPGIAELEASPVGRRITKDLIREGLEPMSTTGDIVSSIHSSTVKHDIGNIQQNLTQVTTGTVKGSSILPRPDDTRHSILSQTGSSVLNSSTLEFAVRCSIPAMAAGELAHDLESVSGSPDSPEKSTEDGMSELLAGYQHTDSKQEEDIGLDPQATPGTKPDAFSGSGRKSNHAQKSSEVQSFKTCTDVPAPVSPDRSEKGDMKSMQENIDVSPESQPTAENPDDKPLETGHPDPPSQRASSILTDLDVRAERPASRMPVSTPPPSKGRNIFNRHGSAFSLNPIRFRGSSKPSIKQELVSVSDSSSSLNATPQPPLVPPRESSASKEAQRVTAVGDFLLRRVVPSRFSKDKKALSNEELGDVIRIDNTVGDRAQQQEDGSTGPVSVTQQSKRLPKTPEKAIIKQDVVPAKQTFAQSTEEQTPKQTAERSSPTKSLRVGITMVSATRQHSLSSLVSDVPGLSSALLPQGLSLGLSVLVSPDDHRASPEYRPRDSQTTTHLSWIGRKPLSNPSASVSEPYLPLPSLREDTTTDLRLSGYRYNGPHGYLPDLKEESHEDSSLNTSASNLKHSHFRFPHGGGPGMRMSVEDAVLFSRGSSTRSHRKSSMAEGHNLPRMEFSQANLMEKLRDAFGGDIRFSRSSDRPDDDKGSLLARAEVDEDGSVKDEGKIEGAAAKVQITGLIEFAKLRRAYSPQKLKAEIDQLTIPSVTQLTQRFTELLPSLLLGDSPMQTEDGEPLEFPEEEEIMEHAIEEIHHVHPPAQKRSSARLRPVRGSSALMVIDDDVFENITSKEASSGVACEERVGERGVAVNAGEALTRAQDKDKNTTHTPTRQLPHVAESQAPSPVTTPPFSNTVREQAFRKSVDSALSLTRSPRSFVSSPSVTDTRPWNFDKNYPWATTTRLSVDISLPPPAAVKHSPRPGPSHLRNTLSDATTDSFTSARTPAGSPTGNASSSKLNRQSQRLSVFGRTGDQAHAVGERYPTSALSPPTAIFRDHLSTDTSDDEDFTTSRKTKLSLRKRFSSAARNNTNTTPRATRSKVNPTELASPASFLEISSSTLQDRAGEARAFTSNRHTFRDAEGMRTSAYHRHRFVESIKHWCRKGTHLIRTLSRRGI